MIRLRAKEPHGFDVWLDVATLEDIAPMVEALLAKGYTPVTSGMDGAAWPVGPDGKSPLCKKHGGVPMQERTRQGDTWHSHRIVHPSTGQELYCRGYRHGPEAKDGFLVEV